VWIVSDQVVKRVLDTKQAISELKTLENLKLNKVEGVIYLEDYFVDAFDFICLVFPVLQPVDTNKLSLRFLWEQLRLMLNVISFYILIVLRL
jgi:hypothetical protein